MSDQREFLRVPSFDELQSPKRPRRPTWLKMYVRDLEDPAYLGLSLAARGFLSDFQRLAATMQNRVPLDVRFIARKIDAPAHVVGKLLSTCIQLGFVSRFAEDLKTSKDKDIEEKTDSRPIPPSYSNSGSAGRTSNGERTTTPDWQEIDDLDVPF